MHFVMFIQSFKAKYIYTLHTHTQTHTRTHTHTTALSLEFWLKGRIGLLRAGSDSLFLLWKRTIHRNKNKYIQRLLFEFC